MRRILIASALLLAAGCAQEEQALPFEATGIEPVTRTISSGPTTLTSPAGVSVTIPQGAAASGTTVTLRPVDNPPPLPAVLEPIGQAFQLEFSNPVSPTLEVEMRVSTEGLSAADLVRVVPVIVPLRGDASLSVAASDPLPEFLWFGSPRIGWESPVIPFQVLAFNPIPNFLSPRGSWRENFGFETQFFGLTVSVGPFGTVTVARPPTGGPGGNRSLTDGRWRFACSLTDADDLPACTDAGLAFEASEELLERYPDLVAGAEMVDAQVVLTGSTAEVEVDYDVAVRAAIGATYSGRRFTGDFQHTGSVAITPVTSSEAGTITAAGRTYRYEFPTSGSGFTLIVEETIELANEDGSSTPVTVKARVPMTAF